MNQLSINILKSLRKLYAQAFDVQPLPKPVFEQDPDVVSSIIYEKLMGDQPCMIARFGSTELATVVNYLGVKHPNKSIFQFIKNDSLPWWWNGSILRQMQRWSGFFPPTQEKIEQFCELMIKDMKEVDVLGSWLGNERYFEREISDAKRVWLDFLNPFFSKQPWSRALRGKKVLVVHPFSETINAQYRKNRLLFKDQNVLPDFDLRTIKAVQSLGNGPVDYRDWFEALDYMKAEIDKHDYDFCLIGAGAYGFPLAAHVKRQGKKSIHLGGSLQLLFGIRGRRWDDPNLNKDYNFTEFINEHWVRPSEEEKPSNANSVEGACYW